jgi:N utilization substance protein A
MSVKLETHDIRTIAAFEKITKVHPKDCLITEEQIYFLVDPDKVGFAIGRGGAVIKEVIRVLGKPVKVLGYYNDPKEMIKSIAPGVKSIETVNGSMIISLPAKDKIALIGKNGNNIKAIKTILDRHFDIKNLRVR